MLVFAPLMRSSDACCIKVVSVVAVAAVMARAWSVDHTAIGQAQTLPTESAAVPQRGLWVQLHSGPASARVSTPTVRTRASGRPADHPMLHATGQRRCIHLCAPSLGAATREG